MGDRARRPVAALNPRVSRHTRRPTEPRNPPIARCVLFYSIAPARTQVREVSLGFGTDQESQQMRAFFERGNAATLGALQRRFGASAAGH